MPKIVVMVDLVEVGIEPENAVDIGGQRIVGLKNSYGTPEFHNRGGTL